MGKALPPWTYSSGEEPLGGDVICRVVAPTHENDCPSIKVGDVHTVTALTRPVYQHRKMPWVNSVGGYDVPVNPRQFILIARAGQRVAYQSGDVVECIEADTCRPLHRGKVGGRYTVKSVGSANALNLLGREVGYNSQGCSPARFRLVHRPIKTVVHPPHARSAFGSNDLTIAITGSQESDKTTWAEFIKTAQTNIFQGAFIMPLPAYLPPATVVEAGSGCATTETPEVRGMDLCEDEGCQNAHIQHVCITPEKPWAKGGVYPKGQVVMHKGRRWERQSASGMPDSDLAEPGATHDGDFSMWKPLDGLSVRADQPPVGVPLTKETAALLQPGDVVRYDKEHDDALPHGQVVSFREFTQPRRGWFLFDGFETKTNNGCGWPPEGFTFIGRPDADGWVRWDGGENPFGDTVLETRHRDGRECVGRKAEVASWWFQDPAVWFHDGSDSDIVAFRLPRADAKAETPVTEKPAVVSRPMFDEHGGYEDYNRHPAFPTVFDMQQRPVFADTEKPADAPDPRWLQDVVDVVEGRQDRTCVPGKYRVYREGGRVIFEDLRPIEAGCPVTSDRAPGKIGDVKGIDPDTHEAWVRWRNPLNRRDYSTINRADLRRAPATQEKS